MNIGIDIDDTLTDSFDYFIPFVAEFFGTDVEALQKENISYGTLPAEWKERELEFCRAYYDKVVPDTPFKENAVTLVNQLKADGHKIFIITARTTDMYTNPYETTKAELDKNGVSYDEIICVMDKATACRERKIDLFIDDSVRNCKMVEKTGARVMLFTSNGNQSVHTPYERVNSWLNVYERIQGITRGYPTKREAERLLEEAEKRNVGAWGNHSRIVATCAEKIARACGMNGEKAYILGLLHDIGRHFGAKHLGHIYDGYAYMNTLGYTQIAKVCLTHSFPTQNMDIYLGKFDIEKDEEAMLRRALKACIYDDYDRLIQLCDALGGSESVLDIEARMADVQARYGAYPAEQWNKNLWLKSYFEEKTRQNIYDVCK